MLRDLGTFLIPLLCGYWFLTHCNTTKFLSLRQSGYHLLFRSAVYGTGIWVAAYILIRIGETAQFAEHMFSAWEKLVPIEQAPLITAGIIIATFLPVAINFFYEERKAAMQAARRNGDFTAILIDESIEKSLPVEITLQTGKSYVGYIAESKLSVGSDIDLVLIAIASGYRKAKSQELVLTTHYAGIIGDQPKGLNDFRVVIRASELVSMRLFDFQIYHQFQQAEESRRNATPKAQRSGAK